MSANTMFQLVSEQGWRRGFANLLRHENAEWWRTRRWWINILVWLVLVNGVVFGSLWSPVQDNPDSPTAEAVTPSAEEAVEATKTPFAVMAGLFGAIGAIIAMQGAIIDEKKNGTAAWVMSKPASRTAFIVAKLVANITALFVIVLVIQGAIAYLQFAMRGSVPPLIPFLYGIVLLTLHMWFYVTLTLMLGTLFRDRGPVLGISLGVLFGAQLFMGLIGDLSYFTPWLIIFPYGPNPGLAMAAMMELPLLTIVPILATTAWSILFVVVALWRFQREEF